MLIAIYISMYSDMYNVYQLMGVFYDRLKLCSTAALDCQTGQNNDRYRKKELSFLLVLWLLDINARLRIQCDFVKVLVLVCSALVGRPPSLMGESYFSS